jgi:heat shock protein HspQ
MQSEKKVMITGKLYRDIKERLDNNEPYKFNIGSEKEPRMIRLTGIYLDTDPEFTRNPLQYAKIDDANSIQVKIEFEE